MVLESNSKAIRPITAALTCLLIELRHNGPNLLQVKQITPYHYDLG